MTTDETLTAYLDGELHPQQEQALLQRLQRDPLLASRLAQLELDLEELRNGYRQLGGNAPLDELKAALRTSAAPAAAANELENRGQPTRRSMMAAACLACVTLGAVAGGAGLSFLPRQKSWREAVAEYQVLYAPETLKWNQTPEDEIAATLERISQRIGLTLRAQDLHTSQAEFKRGQLLDFEGQPLVQLAYLSAKNVPVAFCMTRNGAADQDLQTERREDLPIVHWSRNGVSFMVIGQMPQAELMTMAQTLASRI